VELAINGKRLLLGVLESFQERTTAVLIACLVALTVVFIIDVKTPPDIVLAGFYLVPAAIAAAVLRRNGALTTWLAAVGLQGMGERLGRAGVTTILIQALALTLVVVIVRRRKSESEELNRRQPALARSVDGNGHTRVESQFEQLTRREREVAELAAVGRSAKEIAGELRIGRRTVETHLGHTYAKLGVQSQVDLILRQNGHRPT
jgi:DNA-binding CsgD family transcriptional regulator